MFCTIEAGGFQTRPYARRLIIGLYMTDKLNGRMWSRRKVSLDKPQSVQDVDDDDNVKCRDNARVDVPREFHLFS